MMPKSIKFLSILSASLTSFGWMFWCWHDKTNIGTESRVQTREDLLAAFLFALARIATVAVIILAIDREMKKS